MVELYCEVAIGYIPRHALAATGFFDPASVAMGDGVIRPPAAYTTSSYGVVRIQTL